jgi:hypothetical protein
VGNKQHSQPKTDAKPNADEPSGGLREDEQIYDGKRTAIFEHLNDPDLLFDAYWGSGSKVFRAGKRLKKIPERKGWVDPVHDKTYGMGY